MALGGLIDFTDIPYLSKANLANRFMCSLSFYNTESWRTWASVQAPAGKVIEVQAWPAEALYFGSAPANPNDILSEFLNFMGQRANFRNFRSLFSAILDDILNLSASFAKLDLILGASGTVGMGVNRMAATEVEYILLVCRGMFDLLQELLAKLWETITLTDSSKPKKTLRKTFSDITLSDGKLRSTTQMIDRYGLPEIIADCYARHAPLFVKIRQFRDNVIHHGHQVQTIFHGEKDFLIEKRLGSFLNLDIWRDDETQGNNLVPLLPALAMIVHGTLAACEDFAHTVQVCIQFPDPIVPNMNLYMRGYFNEALLTALADANGRIAEGRQLVSFG